MIIETTAGEIYEVEETGDKNLAHVWFGIEGKIKGGIFTPKKHAKRRLVRKLGTRIIQN